MANKAKYLEKIAGFSTEEIQEAPVQPQKAEPQEDGEFIRVPARKTERIQLLTTKKRRDWLKAQAKKRKISVNELINELILDGMRKAGEK